MMKSSPRRQQKLRFRAWIATIGYWGPTRKALIRFDSRDQIVLKDQIDRLVNQMAELGINPSDTLTYGLPAIAKALAPDQFAAGLALATRLAEQRINPTHTLQYVLPAIAKALAPDQFVAGLALATRLAEQRINPDTALQYGLPAIVQASPTSQAFQANLQALEQLVICSAEQLRSTYHVQSLSPAAKVLNPEEFTVCLALATRLARHKLRYGASPGLVTLTRQAITLKQQYEDFEFIWHEEVTYEEEIKVSGDGYSYGGGLFVAYPEWIELRPVGCRIVDFPLEIIEANQLEPLLTSRSWLWQFSASQSTRERALQRIAAFRVFLPLILDRLIRQGVVEPTVRLKSAYLIGSYPWVDSPNDIDLFLVMDGERNVTFFTSEGLAEQGVQVPELSVPITVEVVGYETLLQASRGESIPNAQRLSLRHTLLYGSILLAGHDLFETIPVRRKELKALRKDLLADRKRADWLKIRGVPAKVAAKQAWRQYEADALARFSSRFQRWK